MFNKTPLFSLLTLLAAPLATFGSQQDDYEQVRKIALRDPKVRAAYAEADRKLEAKILQIDPSLTSYVRRRSSDDSKPTAVTKPAPKPAPKPEASTKPFRRAHVVAQGDTLGSIAIKYGVGIAALKAANHITDERKLAVGHVLAIPNK